MHEPMQRLKLFKRGIQVAFREFRIFEVLSFKLTELCNVSLMRAFTAHQTLTELPRIRVSVGLTADEFRGFLGLSSKTST